MDTPITPADADVLIEDRWERYCDLLAAGNTIAVASRHAFGNLSPDVLRVALGRYQRRMTDVAKEAFEEAQVRGAARMAADTLDIADELKEAGYAPNEANPVAVAKLRIDARQWLASKYDRRRFGSDTLAKTEVSVQVNVNELHLMALKTLDAAESNAPRIINAEPVPALPQDIPADIAALL